MESQLENVIVLELNRIIRYPRAQTLRNGAVLERYAVRMVHPGEMGVVMPSTVAPRAKRERVGVRYLVPHAFLPRHVMVRLRRRGPLAGCARERAHMV